MNRFYKITASLHEVNGFSQWNSHVHQQHPISKVIVTLFFIIMVVSLDKFEIIGLLPFVIFPVYLFRYSHIPTIKIIKKSMIVFPFIIGVGLFNPILDREGVEVFFSIPIWRGWISFFSLLLKGMLTISVSLLLISTTGIEGICYAFRKLHVPDLLVTQILFVYRYLFLFLESFGQIWDSYTLRAPNQKGITFYVWGSLIGQVMLRTFQRGEQLYHAMKLRGFSQPLNYQEKNKFSKQDCLYIACWVAYFSIARYIGG